MENGKYLGFLDKKPQKWLPEKKTLSLYEDFSIFTLLYQLICAAKIPENRHGIRNLQRAYQIFTDDLSSEGEILFELNELFEKGWLICCLGEWCPVTFQRDTAMDEELPDEKEKQMMQFYDQISEGYYEAYSDCEVDLEKVSILACCPQISVEWMEEKGILKQDKENDRMVLLLHEKVWEEYGEYILAKLWDELVRTEHNEKVECLKHWLDYWDMMSHCWNPEKYMEERTDFLEVCLQTMESEKRETWEQLRIVYNRRRYLESAKVREKGKDVLDRLPENPLKRRDFFDNAIDFLFWIDLPGIGWKG